MSRYLACVIAKTLVSITKLKGFEDVMFQYVVISFQSEFDCLILFISLVHGIEGFL